MVIFYIYFFSLCFEFIESLGMGFKVFLGILFGILYCLKWYLVIVCGVLFKGFVTIKGLFNSCVNLGNSLIFLCVYFICKTWVIMLFVVLGCYKDKLS